MENQINIQYCKGYADGYLDGRKDAAKERKIILNKGDITSYPIEVMCLSTRAYGCLSNAGCVSIADAVMLSEQSISCMRNMGKKTASEIACWLNAHGICSGAWCKYL